VTATAVRRANIDGTTMQEALGPTADEYSSSHIKLFWVLELEKWHKGKESFRPGVT